MKRQIQRHLSEFLTDETAAAARLLERFGDADPLVGSLEYDSRNVKPGTLFFALPGLHTDGHKYVADAIEKGAVVVVHDAEIADRNPNVVYLKVTGSRFSMSPIAASFYGFPSRRLLVVGVTGTEGKSTTVYLTWQLLRLMGFKAGFFSTVQMSDGGDAEWNPEHQTTPEAPVVQRQLWEMAENGCSYAVVESSSHGLSPKTNRLGNVEYDAAVFTNLGHEHLEFHGTWEQYRDDKANLFRALNHDQTKTSIPGVQAIPEPFGVVNVDDPSSVYFIGVTSRKTVSYSTAGMHAELGVTTLRSGANGNWYSTKILDEDVCIDIRDRLPGEFNIGNVLASLLAVSGLTGIPVSQLAASCPKLEPVRGRMSAILGKQPFEVMVDYAHTPSSFQTIFPPLRRRLDESGGRIITMFGSAGERDTVKRQEQGKIAAAYSDFIVLTDEDPRGEVPMDIIEEIARGVFAQVAAAAAVRVPFMLEETLFLIPDRPAAIRKAMSLAKPGDIVLLLGKGHENSIIYADRVMPFDEIAEAEKALDEMAAAKGWK
ncbi:MAG: UDP-N-acetylmuramoyl-L-alanyl-D-glutamate--2,6-diaminopimelate ligase [Treponema sp.]|nr:UDP-N-acetylmuramoyl-L-alanyl-D-glutamate--2,6-diaminopimelate ligase [Treponema sp.]